MNGDMEGEVRRERHGYNESSETRRDGARHCAADISHEERSAYGG